MFPRRDSEFFKLASLIIVKKYTTSNNPPSTYTLFMGSKMMLLLAACVAKLYHFIYALLTNIFLPFKIKDNLVSFKLFLIPKRKLFSIQFSFYITRISLMYYCTICVTASRLSSSIIVHFKFRFVRKFH